VRPIPWWLCVTLATLIGCARQTPPPMIRLSPFADELPQRISRLIEPRCWVAGFVDTPVGFLSVNTGDLKKGDPPITRRVLMISCRDGARQLLILSE
jgi:hypothetical protein